MNFKAPRRENAEEIRRERDYWSRDFHPRRAERIMRPDPLDRRHVRPEEPREENRKVEDNRNERERG